MSDRYHAEGTRPIDLASYYLTAHMGVGQALSIPSIQKRLCRYPVNEVLECLSEIAVRADQLRHGQPEESIALARWLLPGRFLDRAETLLADPCAAPISSQVAVNLALHALVVCTSEGELPPKAELIQELGALCVALGTHLGRGDTDQESLAVEITRLGLYFTVHDLPGWLDLAHELFFDVMPSMTDHNDYVDCDTVIREAYGLSLERFWALSVAQGIAVRESPDARQLPQRVDGWNVTDDELVAWTNAWSHDVEAAGALAQIDIDRATGWSFEAFADRPLISLDGSEQTVAVRPAWIASKATPSGMFWAVRHPYVEQGGQHQTWSQFMGRAVEALGRRLLQRYLPNVHVIEENEIATWGDGANCDAILIDGDVVAIDFVFRQFTKESSGTGNFADLAKDLRRAAVHKLTQVDASLAKGLDGGHLPATPLYSMVVVGGPFPVNQLLYKAVRDGLLEEQPTILEQHAAAKPFALVDMSNFLDLLRAARSLEMPLSALLDAWLASGMGQASFRDWRTTDGPPLPQDAFDHVWDVAAFEILGLSHPENNPQAV